MASVRGTELAVLWAALATLFILSRSLGALARRLGQPPVLGALVAGVLLSPDVFGRAWPGGFRWLFPVSPGQSHLLAGVAQMGLVVLSFMLGLETDLALLRRLGRSLAITGSWSFALPLAGGALLGALMPARFIGSSGSRGALLVLMAGALAVSSLPVIAWIARELGISETRVGRMAVGIATIHDGAGFVILAVAVALAEGSGSSRLIEACLGLVGLLVVAVVAPRVLEALDRRSRTRSDNPTDGLGVILGTVLVLAAGAQAAHLDGALGAFVAGIVIGRSPLADGKGAAALEALAVSVFAPIYFATASLQIHLTLLSQMAVALGLIAYLGGGALTKTAGSAVGAGLSGLGREESTALAIGLNGRGAMQIIIASVGLRHGAVSTAGFTVIITGSIITTLLVAPVLRHSSTTLPAKAGMR